MKASERNKPCHCGSGIKAKRCPCLAGGNRIVKYDHPALHTISEPIAQGDDLSFLTTMEWACRKRGVGLAANQIGVAKRAVYIDAHQMGGFFMLNPVIVWKSDETSTESEGCLSFPGIQAMVERHDAITVEWDDASWMHRRETFEGFTARVIQHEADHLDAVCQVGDEWKRREGRRRAGTVKGAALMAALVSMANAGR